MPQTLSEIRSILAQADISPRQRLGQHFLIDLNLMRKLVDAAQLCPADVVLEVGAGTGSLTEALLESGCRVIAVEIDPGLQTVLRQRLGGHPRLTLMAADVLAGKHQVNPAVLRELGAAEPAPGGQRKLVANLPYQVATPLLMELLHARPPLERLVCTIQKEVAQRILARPGSGDYGALSVAMQTLATVETIARAPPEAFWPRPRVESVMLRIWPRTPDRLPVQEPAAFVEFVRSGFAHRRKMLRSAVHGRATPRWPDALRAAGIEPTRRPESLSPSEWQRLYAALRGMRT